MHTDLTQRLKLLFIFFTFLLLMACAAKGPEFSKVSNAPEGKSVLYIYRPWAFTGGGVSFPIVINDKKIYPKLSNQSYLRHPTLPGKKRIHTDTSSIDRILEFKAEPNKIYFISISVKNYLVVFEQVPLLVDEELALQEIEKCKIAL